MPAPTKPSIRNLKQGVLTDSPASVGTAVDDKLFQAPLPGLSDGSRRFPRIRRDALEEGAGSSRRVLFIASSLGKGGIERHSAELASRLIGYGIDITFVCAQGSFLASQCQARDIPTELLKARNSADIGAILRLAAFIQDLDPGIVHVHSRRDFVPASLAVLLARKRMKNGRSPQLIIHSHLDKPLGSPRHLARRLFASASDTVVAVSEAVKARLLSRHGFAQSFVRVLYNGIDPGAFLPVGTAPAITCRKSMREKLGIPTDGVVIGMVGRLDAKGQIDLLSAAGPLLRRERSIWVVLVGPEGRKGDLEVVRKLAQTEGILPRVVITGTRDDVPSLLPAFDVLVHLPKTESFGLALVEAMASGLPVIATNTGGCSEVVVHNSTGIIVPVGDRGSLHTALIRLLISDAAADTRQRMGQEGRKVVCARFSVEQQIQRLMCLYDELAVGGNR